MSSDITDEEAVKLGIAVQRLSLYCCGCVGLLCGSFVTIVAIIAYVLLHK